MPAEGLRLLLVNPALPESFWSFRWALEEVLGGKRSLNPPLGLATLAALCPPHWEVTIVDENVEPLPAAPQADLIGIGAGRLQSPEIRRGFGSLRSASIRDLRPGPSAILRHVNAALERGDRVFEPLRRVLRDVRHRVVRERRQRDAERNRVCKRQALEGRAAAVRAVPEVLAVQIEEHR